MKKYTTSVVLSAYNGEKYIIEQMESLRKQTIPPDEVLVFDDRSTDSTLSLVQEYIRKHDLHNWKLQVNEQNKGWRQNFVDGISEADGDLIFPCDQDDIWLPNKLEETIKVMQNTKINVLVSYLYLYFENGTCKLYPGKADKSVSKVAVTKNFMNIVFPGCVYCIRKEFSVMCNKYWKPSIPHDALYWRLAMFDGSLYCYHEPLIRWRKHSDSTFTVAAHKARSIENKKKELEYIDDVIEGLEEFFEDYHLSDKEKSSLLRDAKKWLFYRNRLLLNRQYFAALKLLRYVRYYPRLKRYLLDIYIVLFRK